MPVIFPIYSRIPTAVGFLRSNENLSHSWYLYAALEWANPENRMMDLIVVTPRGVLSEAKQQFDGFMRFQYMRKPNQLVAEGLGSYGRHQVIAIQKDETVSVGDFIFHAVLIPYEPLVIDGKTYQRGEPYIPVNGTKFDVSGL